MTKGEQRVAWAQQHMPVLQSLKTKFAQTMPFHNIRIGACLHLTKETAVLLETLQLGGAEVFACASNPLSTQDDVVDYLRSIGMKIFGFRGETVAEYNMNLDEVAARFPAIIIDDGADLTVRMLEFNHTPIGGLEETTAGVKRIKLMDAQGKIKYPIIAVNNADTKHLFDNVYGTGQSVIDGIMRSTNPLLPGKNFVVAGYGNCGRGLAVRAKGMGCNVIVTEIDPIKALQAIMDGYRVMPMKEAAEIGDIFVTVTGNRDVLDFKHFMRLKDGAILANAGHFDIEVNVEDLKKLAKEITPIDHNITEYKLNGKKVYLLNEGRLVNLASAEGHPSEVMDMSFANQALCAELLAKTSWGNGETIYGPGVHEVPQEIDVQVANLKLESIGISIDKLSRIQEEYLGSW